MRLSLLLLALLSVPSVFADNTIQISNAWINEAPPTVKVIAGYLTIKNISDKTLDLITASSPDFEKIEFHSTKMEDGIASMQKIDVIVIPASSEFSFSPGEYHLMLFNGKKALKEGDSVPLELTFSDGQTISIHAEVKRANITTDISTEHHHH